MNQVFLLLMVFVGWATALSGDLRLVRNGLTSPSYSSGRLEVYYGGRWKSVCYDGWTTANTRVACRQLGFDGAAASTTNSIARFGTGTWTKVLDNLNCAGFESRLISCSRNSFGSQYCSSDVAIYCSSTSCSSSQFRCTNGQCISSSSRCNGIETCFDGSDEMNCTSCQNGGFWCSSDQCISSSEQCNGVSSCSDGSDEMNCTSCQSGAFRCSNGQCIPSSSHCDRTQDCTDGSDEAECTQYSGDLRLVQNGFTNSSYTSGRLEIYHSGLWKNMCDYTWSTANTRVACRQLGFSTSNTSWSTSSNGEYGFIIQNIWLDSVRCSGTESRLTSCSRYSNFYICNFNADVAIDCSSGCNSTQFECTNGQCISSSSRCNGHRTCSDGSDERNCTSCQSGAFQCSNGQCIPSSDRCDGIRHCTDGSDETGCSCYRRFRCTSGQCVSPYYRCDGTRHCSDGSDETGCVSCSGGAFHCTNRQCIDPLHRCDGTRDCTDGSDETGCFTSSWPRSGDLRLMRNGVTSRFYKNGRLEVYYSGQWGTVCIDGWTQTNTHVACRQLGFTDTSSTSYRTSSAAGFGSTQLQIWLDDVRCSGTESRLTSCSRNSYGSHNCDHSKDVAIYCSFRSNTGSGTSDTGTSVGGSVGGVVGTSIIILFVLSGCCRFARSASRMTTTTQPVAPVTTVAMTRSQHADETNFKPPSNPSQDPPPTNEKQSQVPPPPYESNLSQAPPPSYEACSHPSQAPPPSYEMCTYPPQTATPLQEA